LGTIVNTDETARAMRKGALSQSGQSLIISRISREFAHAGSRTVIGTLLNDRFALEKELGRGGMGAVYRATDQLLGRSVAIKVLKDLTGEEVGRKIRLEAQILARLLHENIVRLYDFGIANGTYFLVMEEVDGSSFQKRWRKITLPERLQILAQTAEALDYAHHQGVIHRDVKPANILLTSADQAKLSDFGLSMMGEQAQETGVTRGTPHFMSPEQARGLKLDHRSDLYALGVILYECATGSAPFEGPALTVMSQHVSSAPVRPRLKNPEISAELEAFMLGLLAKKPDDRPGSGRAVAQELRAFCQNERWRSASREAVIPRPAAHDGATLPATKPKAEAMDVGPVAAWQPAGLAAGGEGATFTTKLQELAPSLAREMIDAVEADPIILSADERYLFGHYLAYLLGGARKRGLFRRRPLDKRNADRARLLLGMSYIMVSGGGDDAIARAAGLLESRTDVRPALSPIIVAKYLAARSTEGKRRRFRQVRKKLKEASAHAQKHMLDARGGLNPGLMPLTLDDLRKLAPARTDVDDQLVQRWNRLTEIWRGNFTFRQSVLRYATQRAYRDPASYGLWPEVVYPLIERARWQRRNRSNMEGLWDAICSNLHLPLPDAGLRLDEAFSQAVPLQVVEKLDIAVAEFQEEPEIEEPVDPQERDAERLSLGGGTAPVSYEELAAEGATSPRGLVRLAIPDPVRFTLSDLGTLWREAITSLKTPSSREVHKAVPIGPYRLVVIPTMRGKSAGTVAIQGMPNKQIELLTPSLRAAASTRPIVALWVYRNNSLVIAYTDFKSHNRYILWDATILQQTNFDDAATLNHDLLQLGLESPDQLDRVLTKNFRPSNTV
jgi:eukaryotic-like serine/threonine-protein kinase